MGGFLVKPRLWIFYQKSSKFMDFRSKMASEGPNEHTLRHFAARVGRGMGPPISRDLEKLFLTRLNEPHLQFGAVYG